MKILTPVCLALATGAALHAQAVLFLDDFETDTSANWSVFDGSGNGTPDYTVQFNFDYGTTKYTYTDAAGVTVTNTIPTAPHSVGGTTRGVKLTVNKNDDVADTAGVSLYPKGQSFSGNYALRCDLWLNYNGGIGGGSGSTEFATFGINHTGTQVNWTSPITDGDGIWFAATGEGGAARDFRAYEYDGTQAMELIGAQGGLIGADDGEAVFQDRFPSPPFETAGAVGKRWVQVEVAQRDGMLVWKLDGYVIAERPNGTTFTTGDIMIGTMDVFTSVADPKADNFAIFDNVRVVNLDQEPAPAAVRVEATDAEAAEPGSNTGIFTITRVGGDQTKALPVSFRLAGTATPGVDYETNAFANLTATIPANADSVQVVIKPIDDFKGEPTETVVLVLTGGEGYELRDSISASVDLLDDGDVTLVQIETVRPQAYEAAPDVPGLVSVYRLGDLGTDLKVNLKLSGTAINGTDYELLPTSVTIPTGETNALVTITPIDDNLLEDDETVTVTVDNGAGYAIGAKASATVSIGDNEQAAGPTVFADDFDTDTAGGWLLRFGAGNGISDYVAEFAYDYSQDGIPSAPHSDGGTTKGVKVTVNKNDATASAAGVNIYPKGLNVSGDFSLRFDMYLTCNLTVAGTTEHAIFGIDHSGSYTNRHGTAGGDGLWFAVETDGSASSGRSYVSYVGNKTATPTFTARPASDFGLYFAAPPYLAKGAASGNWVDVDVTQKGDVVTWKINGLTISRQTNATEFKSGTIMLGHMDTFNSIGSPQNFTVFDNVRVVSLQTEPPPAAVITGTTIADGALRITFTSAGGEATDFTVVTADAVTGAFAVDATATIQKTGNGEFVASVPLTAAPARFHRIKR